MHTTNTCKDGTVIGVAHITPAMLHTSQDSLYWAGQTPLAMTSRVVLATTVDMTDMQSKMPDGSLGLRIRSVPYGTPLQVGAIESVSDTCVYTYVYVHVCTYIHIRTSMCILCMCVDIQQASATQIQHSVATFLV